MAYDDILPGGTTGHLIEVFARDTSTGQGKTGLAYSAVTAKYQRQGAAALQPVVVVDGTLGTFVSGGWKELGSGWYQFGVPNAALATGVGGVGLSFHASGMIDISRRILLTTSNLRISTPAVAPGGSGGLGTVDGNNRVAGIQGTKNTLDALQDLSQAQAQTAAGAAVAAYDPPTRAEATADKDAVLGAVAGLNDVSASDVQTAAVAALTAYDPPTRTEAAADRDEILSTLGDPAGASLSADVAAVKSDSGNLLARLGAFAGTGANTVLGFLRAMSRKDLAAPSDLGGSYAPATDSLEGTVDTGGSGLTAAAVWAHSSRTLTQTAAQVTEAIRGSTLVISRGDRVVIALTGLGSLADNTQVWFTVKADPANDTDAQAVLQVARVGGLLRLNGSAAAGGNATLAVDDAEAGNITITLAAAATAELAPGERLAYDVQALFASGPVTKTRGRCDVAADVTRAIA